jgi:LuxR family transcriptional regulator, maltose regulon positive regulatory protein
LTVDPLLTTKLRVPAARPDQVARPRLVARIAEGIRLGRRLTLVSAPPGFGKTTAVREWAAGAASAVAWLTLDEDDNEPARFVRYVATAAGFGALAAGPDLHPQSGLVALINALAESGEPVALVLDDYHAIRHFGVHDLVAFLIAHQPPCFHLVIGTREDPPLPLARLRARAEITEIREAALRFSVGEVASFLTGTLGLALSPAAVTSLATRTEGWITALQLAGLALSQPRTLHGGDEFIVAFAGDDRYVADYLLSEVLDRQPDHLRTFLQQTAVLDRLSAPLAAAVTGREDAQALLEQLEAANLFLSPLDNRREWYRYHGLFAEMLRMTLPAAQQSQLHRKAAGWCDTAGLQDLAVQHARRAAELARVEAARPTTRVSQPLIEPLSERELEVLALIAAGLSNQEIADRLVIATGTVKRHINNIYGKLQVGSRTQAVAAARDLELL